ncbi:hypothetical protein [Melissospora conviva]|uniref:hypothetical protein n=1 Tax=Melissospora conviva TaxID=3388432 RepID=UPI003C169861
MTIELGRTSETVPSSQPPTPRLPGRGPRLALLLVLLLPFVGGEQPVTAGVPQAVLPSGVGPEGIVVAASGGVSGHLLLGVEPPGQSGAFLTARRLPGGDGLWRVPSPFDAERYALHVTPAADVLVAQGQQRYGRPEAVGAPVETVAFARADGTIRWRHPGAVRAVTRAGPVLLHDDQATPATVSSIDPGSGRVRWSSPLAEGGWPLVHEPDAATPGHWILIDPAGRLEVRDLDANRLLGSRDGVSTAQWTQFRPVGDILLLGDEQGATAYGLPDLRPRWELGWRLDEETIEVTVGGCGATACLVGDADGLRALDPRTGEVRWSSPRPRTAWPAGESVLVIESSPAPLSMHARLLIADADSGRQLRDLGTWTLAGLQHWGSPPLVVTRQVSGHRLMVAVLRPGRAEPEVLGIVDGSSGGCAVRFGAITCRRFDRSEVVLMVPDEHRPR